MMAIQKSKTLLMLMEEFFYLIAERGFGLSFKQKIDLYVALRCALCANDVHIGIGRLQGKTKGWVFGQLNAILTPVFN